VRKGVKKILKKWVFTLTPLRIWLKNRIFFGWYKFVNAYVERDKKNGKKW